MNFEPQHVCHGGCPKHNLRWDLDKALQYAGYLENDTDGHCYFMKATEEKDVKTVNTCSRAAIILAACTSGMGKFLPCVSYRKN